VKSYVAEALTEQGSPLLTKFKVHIFKHNLNPNPGFALVKREGKPMCIKEAEHGPVYYRIYLHESKGFICLALSVIIKSLG
jgi:hypothetical protein